MTGSLLTFAAWLPEALRWYRSSPALLLDGDGGHPFGANVSDALFWVFLLPATWALPFGILGSALAARLHGPRHPPVVAPVAPGPAITIDLGSVR